MSKIAKNGSIKLMNIPRNVRNKSNSFKRNAKKRLANIKRSWKISTILKEKRLLRSMKK